MSKQEQYPKPGTESYLNVPGHLPLQVLTMGNLIDKCAQKFGNKEAIVVSTPTEVRKTFIELKKEADDLAAGLLSLGLQKGDRLGIWGPNSYEWYLTHAAGMKAGLIIVNINPAFQTSEISYCLEKVRIKCMVIADQFKSSNYYNMMVATVPEILTSELGAINSKNFPDLKTLISFSTVPPKRAFPLQNVLLRGRNNKGFQKLLLEIEKLVQFDDVCNIQFTSGTTGKSKGVMLSHHNIINNGFFCGLRYGYTENDKICVPVPLFHCFGSVEGVIACLHSGATCVLPSPAFSPKAILDSIAKERCTIVYGTPTMHIDILNVPEFEKYDVSSLRLAVTGASIYPIELIHQMKTKYTVDEVVGSYGMTETSPLSFQSLPTDTDALRAGTVGYPVDHSEIKIVDTEGRIVKVGQQGEMCIRGYLTMLGYWEDFEKTSETIDKAKWLHTGDLAVLSASGHARIVGRLKDVIIRGGENVYPREVEDFIYSLPEIQEVQVFGVPDSRMGEEVGSWVRLKQGHSLTEAELKSACKGKIAHFKIPKYVIFTKDFPKTTSGKIQKWLMRDSTISLLGLGRGENLTQCG